MSAAIERVMRLAPVIPVLVIEDAAQAEPMGRALVAGGLKALEVTLRTPAALEAITAMSRIAGAVVGAGTILRPRDVEAALKAGAQFLVSPGLTPALVDAAKANGAPLLPGVATASEILRGLELGLTHFKFFPAEANGGVAALKALIAPIAEARFCPTGGVTLANAPHYLALESVLCVGGSWMVPKGALDPGAIEAAARQAAALG